MTTPIRWTAIIAAGLLAMVAACSSADPAPSGAAPAVGDSSSPRTEEEPAKDTSAAKEFCKRYNEYMGDMMQGGDAAKAALPKLDTLIDAVPAEFKEWAVDFSPWVKAQVKDDSAAINAAADAAEEAGGLPGLQQVPVRPGRHVGLREISDCVLAGKRIRSAARFDGRDLGTPPATLVDPNGRVFLHGPLALPLNDPRQTAQARDCA